MALSNFCECQELFVGKTRPILPTGDQQQLVVQGFVWALFTAATTTLRPRTVITH
jgi:hypothetical protein